MHSAAHSRNPSEETNSSNGASQVILDHIMQYPTTYEIPLRDMYDLNQRALRSKKSAANSNESSPVAAQMPQFSHTSATADFTSRLMAEMSKRPLKPAALPLNFTETFVRKTFCPNLIQVDFNQGFTALDYLNNLEQRRRREVRETLERLRIDEHVLSREREQLTADKPGCVKFVDIILAKEKKLDPLYSSLYIGFRRWVRLAYGFFVSTTNS
jgi:hypothetical protein